MEKGNGIGMGKGSGELECRLSKHWNIGVRTVKALELEWGLSKHWSRNRPPKVWATPLVHFSDIILPGSLPGNIISILYHAFFACKTEAEHAKLA